MSRAEQTDKGVLTLSVTKKTRTQADLKKDVEVALARQLLHHARLFEEIVVNVAANRVALQCSGAARKNGQRVLIVKT